MSASGTVHIVDDNHAVRQALAALVRSAGFVSKVYPSAEAFLAEYTSVPSECLLLDVRMPGMSGLELQKMLNSRGLKFPIIFLTGHGDIPMAVDAMQLGAMDFIEKPCNNQMLLEKINHILTHNNEHGALQTEQVSRSKLLRQLTPREKEILKLLVDGKSNKVVAARLAISPRTVEVHRANIMGKLQAHSLVDLVRIYLDA